MEEPVPLRCLQRPSLALHLGRIAGRESLNQVGVLGLLCFVQSALVRALGSLTPRRARFSQWLNICGLLLPVITGIYYIQFLLTRH